MRMERWKVMCSRDGTNCKWRVRTNKQVACGKETRKDVGDDALLSRSMWMTRHDGGWGVLECRRKECVCGPYAMAAHVERTRTSSTTHRRGIGESTSLNVRRFPTEHRWRLANLLALIIRSSMFDSVFVTSEVIVSTWTFEKEQPS